MSLNCPNCGAPIDPQNNKCAYCNTSYFDLSAIDLNENKPFYLKIKYKNKYITQLVRLKTDFTITIEKQFCTAYRGSHHTKQIMFPIQSNVLTNLNFEAIDDGSGHLITVIIEEK